MLYCCSNRRNSYKQDEEIEMPNSVATSDTETTMSTDTSANATPLGSSTPMGTVVVPGQERSGTVLRRTQWDSETRTNQQPQRRTQTQQAQPRTTSVVSWHLTQSNDLRRAGQAINALDVNLATRNGDGGRWRTRDGRRRGDESGWGD